MFMLRGLITFGSKHLALEFLKEQSTTTLF
jgi:hypothetical protein